MAPREALDRLIGEQLLIVEAQRRGFDRDPGVEHVAKQALVQALLAHVVERGTVTDSAITEAYERQRTRFEVPEKRRSRHVLFVLARPSDSAREQAAMRLAERAVAELKSADDPVSVWERYRALGSVDGFEVKAEDIPLASRSDSYAPEYLQGLFSLQEPGVVETPARTDFGWHAIVVTEIAPAQFTPLAEARALLRRELLESQRKDALEALVRELSAAHPVQRNEAAIDALLHAETTPAEADEP